mgnify:CR=1 FL=1
MPDHLSAGIILYHGSYCEVSHPDLSMCARYKDFGRGFYLTTDSVQAENFAKLSTRKAAENGIIGAEQDYGVVSSFVYNGVTDVEVKVYEDADKEWLHCIVAHRKRNTFPDLVDELRKFDIIGGKIANDDTNATILAYMAGTFGTVGTEMADEICIRLLLPDRLRDQYCFRTEKALASLEYVKSEKICL